MIQKASYKDFYMRCHNNYIDIYDEHLFDSIWKDFEF